MSIKHRTIRTQKTHDGTNGGRRKQGGLGSIKKDYFIIHNSAKIINHQANMYLALGHNTHPQFV